ncbi:hypothetical protein [Bradyrhizobium sp. BR 10289]|uniref:hypothetical protein n=1 Tax=Bradyrhizobium sp. BR 10289 TaxID=2749993 RepID=UPI001C6454D0|nr:hypothetical protein [Bradyrhizobium sp. BR 10289]MBW7971177.1 hypothetical protein [Bradyrhizobium sp. BR 10289]
MAPAIPSGGQPPDSDERPGSGVVGYNVEIAVDTEHHLIVTHEVTNSRSNRHHQPCRYLLNAKERQAPLHGALVRH